MLVVVADVREQASGVPQRLEALGAQVELRRLTTGDYVIGPEALVERKAAKDLHASIVDGRLWNQMGRLCRQARHAYLLVEGRSLYRGPVHPRAVRRLLLGVGTMGVSIIRSEDAADSAAWLCELAERQRRDPRRGSAYPRPWHSPTLSPQEVALTAAPGIGAGAARELLERYGTLQNIAATPCEELTKIRGVSKQRAEAILALIRDQPPTDPPN